MPAATTASTMTVTRGITLNVRSGAATSYSVRGSLEGGSTVSGFDQGNGWFKLNTGQYAGGYISYLSPVPGTPTAPTGSTTPGGSFHGTVVKTLIRTLLHATPSVATGYVRTLAPGAPVSGTVRGGWLELDGGGYVSMALVTDRTLSNGALPASRLCDVPIAWNSPGSWEPGYTPATVRKLDCVALKSLTGLENAYEAQFGRYARVDLAYRPLSEQNYWYKKFGYPRAAMPGTSNHGLGVAVDFRETDEAGEEFGWGPGLHLAQDERLEVGLSQHLRLRTVGRVLPLGFRGHQLAARITGRGRCSTSTCVSMRARHRTDRAVVSSGTPSGRASAADAPAGSGGAGCLESSADPR